MSNWVTVSRQQHVSMRYAPRQDYQFTAEQAIVPILAGELRQALTQFVMGFIKREERYYLVALLGRAAHSHHYIHPEDGRWLGTYVPAHFRGYPFAVARQKDSEAMVLQVHADHLLKQGGEPLFDEQGELAEQVKQQLDFVGECAKNRRLTNNACQALAEQGILQPWQVNEGGPGVKGLYQVEEAALNKLTAQQLHSLQGMPLAVAYGQIFSMAQHDQLAQRAALHAKLGIPESVDELFADDSDDLQFDFG
ncbi:SapC family protein [Halomonas sp. ISL-56]|uniref:SapC family protein n=1 Tax=Halomonas sp. ISL-56 TaxID=2819149 RepID=UPI001BECE393|nr:SapC family protein [Halomonas sp. ISL-56]MBT2801010.1 SapC family protein [Halomonas sp. ISL-56]